MLLIEYPVSLFEARALFERCAGGMLKPIAGMVATYQLARGEVFGFRLDGALIALIGFYPIDDHHEEVFVLGDRAACAAHMRALWPLARLTLRARAQSGVVGFHALVRSDNEAGQRLARLAGFTRAGAAGALVVYKRKAV